MQATRTKAGFTMVDVIVAIALLVVVFTAISGAFKSILGLTFYNKAKISALSIMNNEMELLRNMSYDSIGTQGGIPAGNIPQTETVTLNGITYTKRVLVQYVDDAKDGLENNDQNGITTDYKRVKVEVSWDQFGSTKKVFAVSNFTPKGMETTAGGGTLIVNVLDASAAPVIGASVTVENTNVSPAISVTTFTNSDGKVMFPGSPAATGYKITVTKSGYSTARTYDADSSNPNPSPGHLTVIEGETTVATFQIDELGAKTIRTYKQAQTVSWEDTFSNTAYISSSASTTVASGKVELLLSGGIYESNGYLYSTNIEHSSLYRWKKLSWNDMTPAGTSIRYKVYYYDGASFVPVPDSDLPGNAAGFTSSPVFLSRLATSTYSILRIAGFLSTNDTMTTPSLLDWKVEYDITPVTLPNLAFTMTGTKTIGTDASGDPIYKYSQNLQTDGSGELAISSLEWDTYTITVDGDATGYDIAESCYPQPLSLAPGTSTTTRLYLTPHTTNSLLVAVRNTSGALLENVSVRLYKSGVDMTQYTSSCGQTIFSGIPSGTVSGGDPYSIDLSLAGYSNTTVTDVDVSGTSKINVVIND